jgi:hypothetical protein
LYGNILLAKEFKEGKSLNKYQPLGIKISHYGTPLSVKYPQLIKAVCSKIGKKWSAIYLYYFGYGGNIYFT